MGIVISGRMATINRLEKDIYDVQRGEIKQVI